MQLLVIVLCLFSERFLAHESTHDRFRWFKVYAEKVISFVNRLCSHISPWIILALIIFPLLILACIVLCFFDEFLFGFFALILNIAIFYYCVGLINPFYPVLSNTTEPLLEQDVGDYFVHVNGQLFAVIFWYVLLGPLGLLAYRLIAFCTGLSVVSEHAVRLCACLDWLPARMTALLYLLVGNFQVGFQNYMKLFFKPPSYNNQLIQTCGMASFGHGQQQTMRQAEIIVEHATVVLLVFLAVYTIVAWI